MPGISLAPAPSCNNQNCVQTLPNTAWGSQLLLVESHCLCYNAAAGYVDTKGTFSLALTPGVFLEASKLGLSVSHSVDQLAPSAYATVPLQQCKVLPGLFKSCLSFKQLVQIPVIYPVPICLKASNSVSYYPKNKA